MLQYYLQCGKNQKFIQTTLHVHVYVEPHIVKQQIVMSKNDTPIILVLV